MIDISIGAVGAAIIAAMISILGLVIGKEQKTSEFRQNWIDELRKCMISYLVSINAVCDAVRLKNAGRPIDDAALVSNYKLLNEANHGIKMRLNPREKTAIELSDAMAEFEIIASSNSTLTPDKIKEVEKRFLSASKDLLKFEWDRVKRGEPIFVLTKKFIVAAIVSMVFLMGYMIFYTGKKSAVSKSNDFEIEFL